MHMYMYMHVCTQTHACKHINFVHTLDLAIRTSTYVPSILLPGLLLFKLSQVAIVIQTWSNQTLHRQARHYDVSIPQSTHTHIHGLRAIIKDQSIIMHTCTQYSTLIECFVILLVKDIYLATIEYQLVRMSFKNNGHKYRSKL